MQCSLCLPARRGSDNPQMCPSGGMVDAGDSKSPAARRAGSSPALGTTPQVHPLIYSCASSGRQALSAGPEKRRPRTHLSRSFGQALFNLRICCQAARSEPGATLLIRVLCAQHKSIGSVRSVSGSNRSRLFLPRECRGWRMCYFPGPETPAIKWPAVYDPET